MKNSARLGVISFSPLIGLAISVFVLLSSLVTARAGDTSTHWRFNFTPALVSRGDGYGWGGGIDPEVRFGQNLGWLNFSLGARVGAYYAKNMFGAMAMPTLRLTLPIGALDTYAATGVGRGWIPKDQNSDAARMVRVGLIYHFSERLALGVEGTHQEIIHSDFRFFSMGSMMSFGF